jgi:hypothetical protein
MFIIVSFCLDFLYYLFSLNFVTPLSVFSITQDEVYANLDEIVRGLEGSKVREFEGSMTSSVDVTRQPEADVDNGVQVTDTKNQDSLDGESSTEKQKPQLDQRECRRATSGQQPNERSSTASDNDESDATSEARTAETGVSKVTVAELSKLVAAVADRNASRGVTHRPAVTGHGIGEQQQSTGPANRRTLMSGERTRHGPIPVGVVVGSRPLIVADDESTLIEKRSEVIDKVLKKPPVMEKSESCC